MKERSFLNSNSNGNGHQMCPKSLAIAKVGGARAWRLTTSETGETQRFRDFGGLADGMLFACIRHSDMGCSDMHNKRLEAFRSNPGGDWLPADFEITASQYAVKFRKVTGTHVVFTHPSVRNCVAIPLKKKVRAVHVRAFIDMIDRMDELDR